MIMTTMLHNETTDVREYRINHAQAVLFDYGC